MNAALKAIVVPKIRALGFVGSLPHFRRKSGSAREMLMVQFNRYGGSFCLEAGRMSQAELERLQESWRAAGKPLTEAQLTVGHCHWRNRARLGGTEVSPNTDHWFVFAPSSQSSEHLHDFDAVAANAARAVEAQVEPFFRTAP